MARLTQIRSTLPMLKARVVWLGQDERAESRARDRTVEGRRLYKTTRWRKTRMRVLTRDLFTCQMCGRIEIDTSRLVADHRIPHRGDEVLFWDEANLWCLCAPCHNGEKQRQERAMQTGRGGR